MKADYSKLTGKTLHSLPETVRRAFFKQIKFLEQDLMHPSLRAKKYDATLNLWQARVNRSWRFYFLIQNDIYYIVAIIPHPK